MSRFIAGLAALVLASSAFAAVPTTESVDTLLTVTKTQKVLDTMLVQIDQIMRQSMRAAVADHPSSAEQQRLLDAMATKVTRIFREEMTWDKLRPMYLQVYQETFTQEEVDGLIAFYRSPAGSAFVDKMPIAMQKTMVATQSMMGPMMEKLKVAAQEAVEEAKAAK